MTPARAARVQDLPSDRGLQTARGVQPSCTPGQDPNPRPEEAYLRLPDKDAMVLLAGEVPPALHGAVILAFGFIQNDADPLPRGKQRGAHIGHCPTVPLPNDFHSGAHLQGLATRLRTHPGAGAGCLEGKAATGGKGS